MSKYLLIDTREKPKAIETIIKQFKEAGIRYERTKLLFGDYMDWNRPHIVVDRKQSIQELAMNCTRDHDRFRAELERAKAAESELVILVEQNRYKDRERWIHVETIEDLMLWESPHTTIRGEKVYRVLRAWMARYPIRVVFCDKRSSGKKILEIIYKMKRHCDICGCEADEYWMEPFNIGSKTIWMCWDCFKQSQYEVMKSDHHRQKILFKLHDSKKRNK